MDDLDAARVRFANSSRLLHNRDRARFGALRVVEGARLLWSFVYLAAAVAPRELARRPGIGDTGAMPTAYKSSRGHQAVRQWCSGALARAGFPLTSATVDTSAGQVQLTSAGTGRPRVVMVPGTGSNAAVALPWLRALSARWPTTVVDLPGQPGLSDPRRPRRARLEWYGRALDEVLATTELDGVILVGNSLGAAVALAADSPRIAARALISPAGFIRLSVDPKLALAAAVWLLRPRSEHTRRMLRLFVAPGEDPPETDVAWMTLVGTCCRTTLSPPPLPTKLLASRAERPCVIGVGEHDRFLPPRRLTPAVRRTMNLDLRVFSDMGHLTTPDHLDAVVSLVAEVADQGICNRSAE
jgi:pimeloyl-ACP methyl ester carboxylesterase